MTVFVFTKMHCEVKRFCAKRTKIHITGKWPSYSYFISCKTKNKRKAGCDGRKSGSLGDLPANSRDAFVSYKPAFFVLPTDFGEREARGLRGALYPLGAHGMQLLLGYQAGIVFVFGFPGKNRHQINRYSRGSVTNEFNTIYQ